MITLHKELPERGAVGEGGRREEGGGKEEGRREGGREGGRREGGKEAGRGFHHKHSTQPTRQLCVDAFTKLNYEVAGMWF